MTALEKLRQLGPKHGFDVLVGGHGFDLETGALAVRWMRLVNPDGLEILFRSVMATSLDAAATDEENARDLLSRWALARMGVE